MCPKNVSTNKLIEAAKEVISESRKQTRDYTATVLYKFFNKAGLPGAAKAIHEHLKEISN